jgi:hypothetical protein
VGKGDLLVGFPRPEQVYAWWEESHSVPAPESTEHPEQLYEEGHNPLTYAENGVRHSSEHQPDAAEHSLDTSVVDAGVRQENGSVRLTSEQENGLSKGETTPDRLVFGAFGGSEDEERPKIVAEGVHRLFEEHPEYRKRRLGQIACRLHMSQYTSFVPTDQEVEAAMGEAL